MNLWKKICWTPYSYKEKATAFTKIDGLMALGVFAMYCVFLMVAGLLQRNLGQVGCNILGIIVNTISVALVFLLLVVRKQGLDAVGLRGGNLKISLIMGGFLTIMLFFCNCLSEVWFEGQAFIALPMILLDMVFYFTVGFTEELLFRGYIQPRLHSLTGHIWIEVVLSAALFVLMHYPCRMVVYQLSFVDFISNVGYMLDLFITALILSFIRTKSDNLWGAVLPHWMSDLAYAIVTHV